MSWAAVRGWLRRRARDHSRGRLPTAHKAGSATVREGGSATLREGGSATVLMIGIVAAGTALLLGALEVARAVATSHRAMAAADLAALAGAREAAAGTPTACQAALRVAQLNGGVVRRCVPEPDGSVTVVVSVVSGGPWRWQATGRARAGPPQLRATITVAFSSGAASAEPGAAASQPEATSAGAAATA